MYANHPVTSIFHLNLKSYSVADYKIKQKTVSKYLLKNEKSRKKILP